MRPHKHQQKSTIELGTCKVRKKWPPRGLLTVRPVTIICLASDLVPCITDYRPCNHDRRDKIRPAPTAG